MKCSKCGKEMEKGIYDYGVGNAYAECWICAECHHVEMPPLVEATTMTATTKMPGIVTPAAMGCIIRNKYPESFAAGIEPTEGMSKEEYNRLWPNRPAKIIPVGGMNKEQFNDLFTSTPAEGFQVPSLSYNKIIINGDIDMDQLAGVLVGLSEDQLHELTDRVIERME